MVFPAFIEDSNRACSPEEVFHLLEQAATSYGFDQVVLGAVNIPSAPPPQGNWPAPAIAVSFPEEWANRYFEEQYHTIDPVLLQSPRTTAPLIWAECRGLPNLTARQKLVFDEAKEFGLLDGVSFPVHAPMGGTYVVSLASSTGGTEMTRHLPMLRALSVQFFVAYSDLSAGLTEPPSVDLNGRERDCLLWSARGKSNWEIGTILGISEHTVDFHFRKAMSKLGCTNRIVAVVTAMRSGSIHP